MTAINSTQALSLLGKSFNFVESIPMPYGPDFALYRARVLAIQVPAPGTDIEWSILLLQDGYKYPEYVDLDSLHFQ